MDFLIAGVACIALLLVLMALGMQIGLSFILSGIITSSLILGFGKSVSLLGQASYFSIASPTWTAIPLFILMGAFASNGGLARRAYDGVHALMRNVKGSLLIATCFSCGLFGAVSGSSIATTAIFGRMALPEMQRLKYDSVLSVGVIASAGTFASMIPPSMMMIIYALFTQQSIGRLFAAGIVPGLMTATVYAVMINLLVRRNPKLAPSPDDERKIRAHIDFMGSRTGAVEMWPVALIAIVILGGIYSGAFTPTEAAAVGSLLTLGLSWYLRAFRKMGEVTDAMRESANITAMLFLINIGALFYSRVLAITGLPTELTAALTSLDVPSWVILWAIMALMFFLGMIMVPVGIYALTLPIVFPVLMKLGYDPVWFGVIALKLTEIGSVTPPVGLNVFAMKGVIPKDMNVSTEQIYKGCMPFLLCDLVVLLLLVLMPGITLWLPNLIAK